MRYLERIYSGYPQFAGTINLKKLAWLGLVVLLLATLVACDNNNSKESKKKKNADKVSLSGKAADGYLRGATVCLDTDADDSCSGEDTATTTKNGGIFTLSATAADFAKHSVITAVTTDTVDEDTITTANPSGDAIKKGETYILSAPPGLVSLADSDDDDKVDAVLFVSPLTTVANLERERFLKEYPNRTDALARAIKSVAAKVDIDEDIGRKVLLEDYIANAKDIDSTVARRAKKMHAIAKVTVDLLTVAQKTTKKVVRDESLSDDNAKAVKIEAGKIITKNLASVAKQVETTLDELKPQEKDIEKHAKLLNAELENAVNAHNEIEGQLLKALIKNYKAKATVTTASKALRQDGGIWFVDFYDSVGFINLGFKPAKGDDKAVSIDACYEYNPKTDGLDPRRGSEKKIVLTKDGWSTIDAFQCNFDFTIASDGGATAKNESQTLVFTSSARVYSLKGFNIAATLNAHARAEHSYWPHVVNADATFGDSTKGTVMEIKSTSSQSYELGSPDYIADQTAKYRKGNSPTSYTFSDLKLIQLPKDTKIIDDKGVIDDEVIYLDVGSMGNLVDFAKVDSHTETYIGIGSASTTSDKVNDVLSVALIEGTATYFSRRWSASKTVTGKVLGTTPYTIKTVNGVQILEIPKITAIADYDHYGDSREKSPHALSVYDGLVRTVYAKPEETETYTVMALNSTAATAVKDNLNLELLEWAPSLPANLSAVAKYAAEAKLASGEKYYGATRSAKAGRWFASRTYTEKDKQFTATDTVSFENDGKKYARDIEISGDVEQIFDGKIRVLKATKTESKTSDETANNVYKLIGAELVYIKASVGEAEKALLTLCSRTPKQIRNGEFECNAEELSFYSRDKSVVEAKVTELNKG